MDRSSYAVSSKIAKTKGRLRMLKISENIGWRDMNLYESLVYNAKCKESRKKDRRF